MSITDDKRSDPWDEEPPPDHEGPAPEPQERRGGGKNFKGGGDRERPSGGAETFERTPPQDVAAEQSVLGGMLLSKDAVADVVEILKTQDFYKPAHSVIYDAILDLYGRGEPADAVTVAAALTDTGNIAKIGGTPYLHTLMTAVPTAANASYYARIVAERAVLRRVIEAGTRIVQLGYGSSAEGGRDVDDVVDLAQQAIYDVTEKRVSEDFAVLAEMLQPTLDEIEAVGAQGGMMTGVPTGFQDLDRLLNGLHAGQLVIVAGRPGLGKALALDTPLPTPDGWTTMGQVRAGDQLLGADGRPTTIVNAFDVLHDRPCYEVEFSDGSVIVADAEHLWTTTTGAAARAELASVRRSVMAAPDELVTFGEAATLVGEQFRHILDIAGHEVGTVGVVTREYARSGRPWRRSIQAYSRPARVGELSRRVGRTMNAETTAVHPKTVTTAEIAATLRHPTDGRLNHAVRNAGALQLPDRALLVAPYTLGAWLGDGHSAAPRLTTADPQIVALIEADGYLVVPSSAHPMLYGLRSAQPKGSLTRDLRALGVLGDKHIPATYLRGSEAQRRALLAGLLDTDGTVTTTGNVQFTSTSERLARDVRELVVSLGYRCTVTRSDVRGRTAASSIAYTLNFTTADDVFRLERKRDAQRSRRCTTSTARTRLRYVVAVRPVASVPVRCVQVDNADHLYLAGEAMIPTHNSTAAMDFSRAASVKHNMASAIFSLEMSKVEIVMRLLSAEARVPLHVLRSGQLSDDDWTKLARRMGEISEAPLFVDDTPSMNLMEIRAKARRLKQRHDLKLIIVDYLQLMTSPKRTESRQQEVADLSRGLKLLAKEVECPVVAVSQLNRGPEQRTDKRPQLSDLRESGCLTAGTRILRADTNAETTLGELLESGAQDVPVWSLNEKLQYVPRTMTHAFPSGRKEVFRMRLASGKVIEATANHPFLTFTGWTPLGELEVGGRIAAPRHVPPPLQIAPWAEHEVVLLAHMLGDGSFVARQPVRYASIDEANLAAVTEAAAGFGVTAIRDEYPAARVTTLRLPAPFRLARGRRNPIAAWLDGLGLFGLRSYEKFLPERVFSLPKEQVRLFLRHLWATDGSVTVTPEDRPGNGGRVYFASTSEAMVRGVARLLLRFGITGRIKTSKTTPHRAMFTLDVSGRDDQLRFVREIGVHGARGIACERLQTRLESRQGNPNVDTVPKEIWGSVRAILQDQGMSHREFAAAMGTQFSGSTLWKHAPSRSRLSQVAAVLGRADLELHATNDVFWDEIRSIESIGEQEVYDATVPGLHNFVANGIATHNSIEQDADVVILLHRDDYYDKESPRAGEADFIVAKHRNGPTDTITVAAQLHLSRFVDMAI
ncbi:replicative DNA helicase [Dactylosporangium sp. NPDC051541]|uniref:replicative DNA helicase n=1 Tax=Dactylosporangium sp. NPDC051541 TaxID=3363977 RepID=UPI0037AD8B85